MANINNIYRDKFQQYDLFVNFENIENNTKEKGLLVTTHHLYSRLLLSDCHQYSQQDLLFAQPELIFCQSPVESCRTRP